MKRLVCCLLAIAVLTFGQSPMTNGEQEHLRKVLQEGSSSTVDLIRALESHLAKFANSPKRPEIERALVKAAMEIKDEARIARYGERVLQREPDDLTVLDRVTHALLAAGDPESLQRSLKLSAHSEELLRQLSGKPAGSGAELAKRKEDVDRALGRAILSQAIATGNLGNPAAAADIARKSFETWPSAEAAVELGRRLAQAGKTDEAVRAYADAFTVPDLAMGESERAAIRARMGELYRKAKGSETGLGEIVLQSYDRNAALMAGRRLALRVFDPNTGLSDPMSFTLSGIAGDKLAMSSLLGKVVVIDFWATWCGPCRAQHPLYEQVKKRFADRTDVVFLSINTDEDPALVKPYLAEQGWSQKVYFEDGLSRVLRVTSIPTTVVFGRNGKIVSRMNGFDPERFVDMLSERIRDGLR